MQSDLNVNCDFASHLTKNQPILFIFRNESGRELEMSDYTPHTQTCHMCKGGQIDLSHIYHWCECSLWLG